MLHHLIFWTLFPKSVFQLFKCCAYKIQIVIQGIINTYLLYLGFYMLQEEKALQKRQTQKSVTLKPLHVSEKF